MSTKQSHVLRNRDLNLSEKRKREAMFQNYVRHNLENNISYGTYTHIIVSCNRDYFSKKMII